MVWAQMTRNRVTVYLDRQEDGLVLPFLHMREASRNSTLKITQAVGKDLEHPRAIFLRSVRPG